MRRLVKVLRGLFVYEGKGDNGNDGSNRFYPNGETLDMVSILPWTVNRTVLVPSSRNNVRLLSFGRSEGLSNVCTQR